MFHSPRWTVLCEYRLLYKLFSISCVHSGRCRVNVTDVSVCQYAYAMNGDFKYFNKFFNKNVHFNKTPRICGILRDFLQIFFIFYLEDYSLKLLTKLVALLKLAK